MITSVSEVQNTLLQQASFFKETIFKKTFLMTSPGCSKEEISLLTKKVKIISNLYLQLVSDYSMDNVSIGYFEISTRTCNKNFIAGLIDAFEDPFFPKEFMNKHNMYQIGSCNTDLVCITNGTGQYQEGEILFVLEGQDIYNPQDDQIKRLAKDFEQFLIVAGNLNQVHVEIDEDYANEEEKRQEFLERLKILNVGPEYYDAWNYIF